MMFLTVEDLLLCVSRPSAIRPGVLAVLREPLQWSLMQSILRQICPTNHRILCIEYKHIWVF